MVSSRAITCGWTTPGHSSPLFGRPAGLVAISSIIRATHVELDHAEGMCRRPGGIHARIRALSDVIMCSYTLHDTWGGRGRQKISSGLIRLKIWRKCSRNMYISTSGTMVEPRKNKRKTCVHTSGPWLPSSLCNGPSHVCLHFCNYNY